MASAKKGLRTQAIILIGFMGAGKTSVGRALGEHLGWKFEDLDDRIEQREQRKIADIFSKDGEAVFRRLEHEALNELLGELSAHEKRIIALGGGAFAQNRNVGLIKSMEIPTVFLEADPRELFQRCKKQVAQRKAERPLLRDLESFSELYHVREVHYRKASFRQQTSGKTVPQIVAELIQALLLDRDGRRGKQK